MDDLRKDREQKKYNQNWLKFECYVTKHKYKIIIFIISLFILLFPAQIGHFIGNWLHEFLTNFTSKF